jgi:hypothetical protein
MKKVIVACLLLSCFYCSRAQTWDEWFRQRKTQIRYLRQQIAALQVYIDLAQKTYKIADEGLTIIGKIKNGDFNLHRDFFGALKAVNPRIANSAPVLEIVGLQTKISQMHDRNIKKARQSEWLSASEVQYLVRIYNRLSQATADNMEELFTLVTSEQYELSDDERIKRIDALYRDIQEKYGFVQWFGDQANLLVANRRKEKQDGEVVQSLILQKK